MCEIPPFPIIRHHPMSIKNLDSAAYDYLQQGEKALLRGDTLGFELFEKASQMDPCNPDLFYRQGLALFEYGSLEGREKSLPLASKKLKIAAHLAPKNAEVWHAWGNVLALLGIALKENRYLLEAEVKLRKTLSLAKGEQIFEIYYDMAKVWAQIAHHSGEAVDLQKALGFFQKSSSHSHLFSAEFWTDWGQAYLDLGQLLNDVHLTKNGIECFRKALPASLFENWLLLARGLHQLFSHTQEEDHFIQADMSFSSALQLSPYNVAILYEWTAFLLEAGRARQDLKKLRACIEKCQQGYILNVKQAPLIAIWAEALAYAGELTDQVDLLYEAQNKIAEALSLDESAEVCHSHAECLYSWGNYFEDLDFYHQAIEKFQEGLSADRTRHEDWYAIAKVYVTIADLDDDITACEKAVRFYAKAIDLKPVNHYYFEYAYALSRLGEMKRDPEFLSQSSRYFEYSLQLQANAPYIYPAWLYNYGITLDYLGDYHGDETYYQKALEMFFQVLMAEPDFPRIHYRLGLTYSHLGEAINEVDYFYRALHHLRLAYHHDEEDDYTLLEWGIALIHIAESCSDKETASSHYQTAELKLIKAARLGNQLAFYQLGCLYSLWVILKKPSTSFKEPTGLRLFLL